jgi:hypothetical protein
MISPPRPLAAAVSDPSALACPVQVPSSFSLAVQQSGVERGPSPGNPRHDVRG